METYLSQQAVAFLWSVVLGAAIGGINDCFRVGRILWKRGAVWVFFEDLLLFFIGAVLTFICLALTNYGQVRLFLLLGELLGFLLYFHTLGVFVTAAARLLSRFFRWIGRGIARIWGCLWGILIKFMNFSKKPFIFFSKWFNIVMIDYGRRKAAHGKSKKSKEIESRD